MKDYQISRFCWLEFNMDNLRDNFLVLKKMVGPDVKIMPAIKVNAYSHGIVACGKVLEECGADYLGVGSIDEGILLRENGVNMPILIFASNLIQETANLYVQYHLIPTILSLEAARSFSEAVSEPSDVFIKIDTGRGRIGVNAEEFPDFFREVSQMPNLHVEGVYSHMAAVNWPDEGADYAVWQYSRFKAAMDAIGEDANRIPFRQLANTPGCIALPDIRMSGICPGRAMWGYSPLTRRAEHPELKAPLVSWKSRLVHVNEVTGGKFGEKYKAVKMDTPKRIGIMVGGMGDGISPKIAGGYVLLHGRKCPVASTVSLEHTILDLTDFPDAKPGDEIVILGRQGEEEITLEQRMEEWGLTVPRIWTEISAHLDRHYYRDGKLWAVAKDERFMTDVHAAIGLGQMKRYDRILARRKEIIGIYSDAFTDLPVKVLSHYTKEYSASGHLYIMRLFDKDNVAVDTKVRNEFITKMAELGVATNVHYKPLPMHTGYKKLGFDIKNYPNAYEQFKNEVTLPLHTRLNDEDVEYVIWAVKKTASEILM